MEGEIGRDNDVQPRRPQFSIHFCILFYFIFSLFSAPSKMRRLRMNKGSR